ncbi:hypothetical protein [Bernardetia sp.]|uniref:hypothetical protein n=1 Tax=Bernardetia sp. TaxID=1937974 RepID=UPI0025BE6D40|nr:hypothetical protein [Bernardetia sp.]
MFQDNNGMLMGVDAMQTPVPAKVMTPHEWFLTLLNTAEMPQSVKERLRGAKDGSGQLKLRPFTYYSKVEIANGAQTVEFFNENDSIARGVRNMEKAKVEEGRIFMIRSIRIRVGTNGGGTPAAFTAAKNAELAQIIYKAIDKDNDFACLSAAELDLTLNSSFKLQELAVSNFETGGNNDVEEGEFVLDRPILLYAQQVLNLTLKFGEATMNNVGVGRAIHLELKGVLAR